MSLMQKGKPELVRVATTIAVLCTIVGLRAQEVSHLTVTQPGGFPGTPVVTGITRTSNGVALTWDGPSGYYRIHQKTNLLGGSWQQVGSPTLAHQGTVAATASNAFFKVSGPAPYYAGAQTCAACHDSIHTKESATRHGQALQTLKLIHQDTNPSCLPCHTVGYGLPTGFSTEQATPQLAGVQCENCHGPAALHAANEMDLTVRPRREIAGQVCGGCHNGAQHPTFDEWKSSGHFAVVEDMNAANRINSCGRCHSGSARLALVDGRNPAVAVTNDANVGITCVVCHDPHETRRWTNVLTGTVTTNQLRYPVASTNYFSQATSTTFSNRYDINVCAQCHNDRGATWSSSGRPPHHSPQYNMLLGSVGELPAGAVGYRASHGVLIEKQCVACHMATADYQSEAHPAVTGHSFQVTAYESCQRCHPLPELLATFTTLAISNQVQQVKQSLDTWATTKAPLALRTKYGPLAWEYTVPGELSGGTNGPSSSEQALIPDTIKRARFNLYIVKNDGSYGVHNGVHTVNLLDAARTWIAQELNPTLTKTAR